MLNFNMPSNLIIKSANYECEQRTSNARTTRELRARTHPRTTRTTRRGLFSPPLTLLTIHQIRAIRTKQLTLLVLSMGAPVYYVWGVGN
jgi:hypothetical protein